MMSPAPFEPSETQPGPLSPQPPSGDVTREGPAPSGDQYPTRPGDTPPGPSTVEQDASRLGATLATNPGSGAAPAGGHAVPPGARQVGDYELLDELGRGGMGVVFKARDRKLQRLVALKMIRGGAYASATVVERFLAEARAAARLDHPHIVPVHEIGEADGLPYFVMALVEGGSLQERLATGPLPPREAAALLRQVAEAVQHAHERGIIHRDLKPQNILLQREEGTAGAAAGPLWPKVSDFGLARALDEHGVTATGEVLGTPSYMPPEQAAGRTREVGPASDVYSLGAVLYCLLTGRPPFQAPSVAEALRLAQDQEPVPPRRLAPGVPRDLQTVCLKCLEKAPARRYASAQALAADLGRFLAGEPVQARPAGPLGRAAKWARRRPAVAGLLAGLAAVVAVAFGVIAWELHQTRAALAREGQAKRERALARVGALLDAAPPAVPRILADLEADRAEVLPRLRELWADTAAGAPGRRTRLALALAEEPAAQEELVGCLLSADDPAEVLLARDALRPHAGELRERLWARSSDGQAKPAERFRALVALAAFDPADGRWPGHAADAAGWLLASDPLHLGPWVDALRPARAALLPPLSEALRKSEAPERRAAAAAVLADYAADRPEVLADLLCDAAPPQFEVLFRALRPHARAAEVLEAELGRPESGRASMPAHPTWPQPDAALRQEVERAAGLLDEGCALCQALPLGRFDAVAEGLRRAGYRPTRLRPYRAGADVLAAAVWTRDGRDWQAALGLSKDEFLARDGALRAKGMALTDVAGYPTAGGDRYAGLWAPAEGREGDYRLRLGTPGPAPASAWQPLRDEGYGCVTFQRFVSEDGQVRDVQIWRRLGTPRPRWSFRHGTEAYYHQQLWERRELLQLDVAVAPVFLQPYCAVWQSSPGRESVESHGLSPAGHLAVCRQWLALGYRPAALSVSPVAEGQPAVAASVWQRPAVPEAERAAWARRQANAAAALLRLGDEGRVWPLLREAPDPTRRNYLVTRFAPLAVGADQVVQRLEAAGAAERRALVLALGGYGPEQLPAGLRERLVPRLLAWYRDDPDPGVHGAIDWLVRHGREGPAPRPLDWGQADALRRIDEGLKGQPPGTRRWYVSRTGQTLAVFPGPVTFRMGAPAGEAGTNALELAHERRIRHGFALETKAVTLGQWRRFLKAHPEVQHVYLPQLAPEEDCPAIGVTWYEAAQYCRWLSEQEGVPEAQMCFPPIAEIEKFKQAGKAVKMPAGYLSRTGYRLPTEAEWEYACRAGTRTTRPCGEGEELLPLYAWYQPQARDRTWPVGQKRPNDFGLFDMLGNTVTWCQDRGWAYRPGEGGKPAEDEDDTRAEKEEELCMTRGGTFNQLAFKLRSAARGGDRPWSRNDGTGLRVARTWP